MSKLGIVSTSDVIGRLKVSLVYKDKVVTAFTEDNLVVLGGKLQLLKALYQGDSGSTISTLRVGDGGTIDPGGKFPKTPYGTQDSLFSEVQSVPVYYSLDLEYPSITYVADIDPDLCNNTLVSEAGLFFEDDVMFNIKTFSGIPKTLDFSIHFEWTIRIS